MTDLDANPARPLGAVDTGFDGPIGPSMSTFSSEYMTHVETALAEDDTHVPERILAIGLLAAAQAYDFQAEDLRRAPRTDALYHVVRAKIAHYRDDRPLADDINLAQEGPAGQQAGKDSTQLPCHQRTHNCPLIIGQGGYQAAQIGDEAGACRDG